MYQYSLCRLSLKKKLLWAATITGRQKSYHGILNHMIYENFEDQLNNEYMVNGSVLKLGD